MKKPIFTLICVVNTLLLMNPFFWIFGVPVYVISLIAIHASRLDQDWKYAVALIPLALPGIYLVIFLASVIIG